MFERFTDRARRVVVLAQEEVRNHGNGYIGTEHLLAGLVAEGEGIAARVLADHITLEEARYYIKADTNPPLGQIPFTPRTKRCLELALREALQFGHNYIGTEHLLLGILREGVLGIQGEGRAVAAISTKVDLDQLRTEVIEALTGPIPSELEKAINAIKRSVQELEGIIGTLRTSMDAIKEKLEEEPKE